MSSKFKNALECYEEIGRWLSEEAPEPWDRIVVDFKIIEIDDVSEFVIVYFSAKNPNVKKQFFVEDTDFDDCFFELARLTSTPEKGLFKKCKFTLYKDGRYTTDFEY